MSDASWIGFAMAALALIGTIANGVNARKVAQDKLHHDSELQNVKHELFVAKMGHDDCKEEVQEVKKLFNECREDHRTAADERTDLSRRLSALEKKQKE